MIELDPDLYTVAWLAPLEIEAQAALHILDKRHNGRFPYRRGDDYIFQAGEICGHNIVIATLPAGQEYGTGSAAALASQVKRFFPNLWFGLLVGVAAGLPDLSRAPPRDIRLGDVLVALGDNDGPGLVAYDLGKETSDGIELLRCGHVLAETEAVIRSAIGSIKLSAPNDTEIFQPYYQSIKDKEHAKGTFADPGQERDQLYETGVDGLERCVNRPRRPDSQRTRVWYGPIGSGEKLMKDAQKRNELRDTYGIIGLEMEAAGTMNRIPVGVIRGVCDYGDIHKNKEWQPYSAAMAAAYAKAVLAEIQPKDPPTPTAGALAKGMNEMRVATRAAGDDVFLLPFPKDPCFVGRESELEHLEDMLGADSHDFIEAAIVGLGGVGKTQIANAYAHRLREKEYVQKRAHDRRSIIWIHASSQARVEHGFNTITRKFSLIPEGEMGTDVFPIVKEWLESEASGRWLLILDNADDEDVFFQPFTSKFHSLSALTPHKDGIPVVRRLREFLPKKPNCAILYTSRHLTCAQKLLQRTRSTKVMEIPMMSVKESIKVLTHELLGGSEDPGTSIPAEGSHEVDEPSMERLVELLGNLPLAITQAASFMRENNLTPEEYISLYSGTETENAAFLEEEFVDWRRDSDMPNAVLCTWKLSFEQIGRKNELAVRLLLVLSALDRHGASDWMLPYFPGATSFQITKATAVLKSFSFISRRDNSMHRLVQLAARAWVAREVWQSAVQDALRFLCNIFAGLNSNEWSNEGELSYSTLRKSLEYYPHTKSVLAALSATTTTTTGTTTGTVHNVNLSRSTLDSFLTEWDTGGLTSKGFADKANEVYQEIITGGYESLTDMILFVRGLSSGSRMYFYKLYRGPYESADTSDSHTLRAEDSGYDHVTLSAAAQYGDERLVKQLLETNKMNVDYNSRIQGRTPLSRASEFGHERIVELLLNTGKVDVNLADDFRGSTRMPCPTPCRTPLLWASAKGHAAVVKLLLETNQVDINAKDCYYGRTPLSWAAGEGHLAVVKLLLETNKAGVDARDTFHQQTPLSWAAEHGHGEIVKLLLETGKVDINSKSTRGLTPLTWAAENGHAAVMKILLETGQVEINAEGNESNKTALSWAMKNGYVDVAELLQTWDATI